MSDAIPTSYAIGSQGEHVKKYQSQLRVLGYDVGEDELGVFGQGTNTAIKKFQKDFGEKVDGIVNFGGSTESLLNVKTKSLGQQDTSKPMPEFLGVFGKGPELFSGKAADVGNEFLGSPEEESFLNSRIDAEGNVVPITDEFYENFFRGAPAVNPGVTPTSPVAPTQVGQAFNNYGNIQGGGGEFGDTAFGNEGGKSNITPFQNAMSNPMVQEALLKFGSAVSPEGFAGKLAEEFLPQLKGKRYGNALTKAMAGEELTPADIQGMTAEEIQSVHTTASAMEKERAETELTEKKVEFFLTPEREFEMNAILEGIKNSASGGLERARFEKSVMDGIIRYAEGVVDTEFEKGLVTLPDGTQDFRFTDPAGAQARANQIVQDSLAESTKQFGLSTGWAAMLKAGSENVPTINNETEFAELPDGAQFRKAGDTQIYIKQTEGTE